MLTKTKTKNFSLIVYKLDLIQNLKLKNTLF